MKCYDGKQKQRAFQAEAIALQKILLDTVDANLLYVLHFEFGFGYKRLLKFYTDLLRENAYMRAQTAEEGYKMKYELMKSKLHNNGVDFNKIQNDALKLLQSEGLYLDEEVE